MLLEGNVAGVKDGNIFVAVPITQEQLERLEGYKATCIVEFEDGRTISTQQRRKCYVLIRYIAEWWGYTPSEAMKQFLKHDFFGRGETLGGLHEDGLFSLSDVDMTTAKNFISYLIEFCLAHDIPCGEPLWKLCEDTYKYVYYAAVHKRCAVCGKKAQWHHAEDRVGMGRTRTEICHLGMRGLPLCAKHHAECHNMAQLDFNKRYLLESVRVDEKIADVYRLRKSAKRKG